MLVLLNQKKLFEEEVFLEEKQRFTRTPMASLTASARLIGFAIRESRMKMKQTLPRGTPARL